MPSISTPSANDPVSQHIARQAHYSGAIPVPLIATSYDISISGGLADITCRRTFRNEEAETIEATLTFPLPVHAVLHTLEARIGERTLKAIAKANATARESYEDAIHRGKTAILHVELLKGVHQISVAHLAPGTEIEVTARFVMALSWIGGRALLRIPTSVGDIYGASGLLDCDDLAHGGMVHAASLKVSCDSGEAMLLGAELKDGAARVPLNAPINIEVKGWAARALTGRTADGKRVNLSIEPTTSAETTLDAAILVDHSGSMNEPCETTGRLSKHSAVLLGLSEAQDDLRDGDRLNLWQFDDSADDLGIATRADWRDRIRTLHPPHGGTEIGNAIATLMAHRRPRDVLLITDGKSHALDVQRLAASGARFTVVLIGDDSLEANVGHLAALSGGEIFAPNGVRVTAAVRSALASMRGELLAPDGSASKGQTRVQAARGGMTISAEWNAEPVSESPMARAVAAYAAAMRMVRMPAREAAAFAEAEGLVTHLTSLVLVDEEGATQAGLPVMRKVALPSPGSPRVRMMLDEPARACSDDGMRYLYARLADDDAPCAAPDRLRHVRRSASPRDPGRMPPTVGCAPPQQKPTLAEPPAFDLSSLKGRIDWRNEGRNLADANMIGLPPHIADEIDLAARDAAIVRAAKRFGISARALVIALIARFDGRNDRYADRTARAILRKVGMKDVQEIADQVGLGRTTRASA